MGRRGRGIFLALLAFVALSCVQEPARESLPETYNMVFSASFPKPYGDRTRTVLQEDGKVFWNPRETIHVFNGTVEGKFTSTNTEAAATAGFEGTMTLTCDTPCPYLAVYPYDPDDASDGKSVTTTVPAVQRALSGTFSDGMSPAVARTESTFSPLEEIPLSFYNVCSGLKFSLAHSDITAITFRGNDGEDVAGKVRIGFDEASRPQVSQVLSGEKEVRLTFGDGSEVREFPAGTWLYLTVLPQTFRKGFTLTFETPTMTGTLVIEKYTMFPRSVWKRAERIDEDVLFSFPDLASEAVDFKTEGAQGITLTRLANDEYALKLSGDDPFIYTVPLSGNLDPALKVLELEYKLESPVDVFQVFFSLNGGISEKTSRKYGSLPATDRYKLFRADISDLRDGGWGKAGDFLRFDPGQVGKGTMHVRNFVIREMTEEERQHGIETEEERDKREIAERMAAYLKTTYPSSVTSVTVTADKVTVEGRCGGEGEYLLADITPWQDVTEMETFPYVTALTGGSFTVTLDRIVPGREDIDYDRVFSKWAVVRVTDGAQVLDSHARYADEVAPRQTAVLQPLRHKKGVAGHTGTEYYQDLDSLGVASTTMNVDLSKIIAREGGSNFTYGGVTYTFGSATGGGRSTLDKVTRQAALRDVIVAAILLTPTGSTYTDPENTGGYYTMPNLTTARAFNQYAAALEHLASRYWESNSTPGSIHHWIMHNEVDQGLIWTNMGNQPMMRYLDRYIKSMRVCYNIVRQYDQEASVLGSYTHDWTSEGGSYSPKEMLERTVDWSEAEGDFRWGVAYHPYPQDLSRPDFWIRDKEATDSDDAPFVTFRNPQVIDRWIRQPRNLYKGSVKRILFFSENGTSSPSYGESDLALQAAGACLAWKKLKDLEGVDGIQWHSWTDNATEAGQGLRLGLHAMAADGMTLYERKPVWYVWRAAGTDQEDAVFAPYLDIIGISSWDPPLP